jgi:hypothetical protein
MATTKKQIAKNQIEMTTNVVELTTEQVNKAILSKEKAKQKRLLNPQFSHLVSQQKKRSILEFKKDGLKVLLNTKKYVEELNDKNYSLAENINLIEKCKNFINFVTKQTRKGEFINEELLKLLIKNVKLSKSGLYSEYSFSQLVQKIVGKAIKKNIDYNTAINLVIAENTVNETKKALKTKK